MATVIRGSDNFDTAADIDVPVVRVYKNAVQAIPNAAWTKVTFETKDFDTSSTYSLNDNRWTPNVAGYYSVGAMGFWGAGDYTAALIRLYKNNSVYTLIAYNYMSTNHIDDWAISGSTLVYMNGTSDYLDLWAYRISTSSSSLSHGGEASTFFGHLVKRA